MTFFFLYHPVSHLHQLQVDNCDSNSRLVVDEDGNGKFSLERVQVLKYFRKHHGEPFFQFEVIINFLASSFRFIRIPMLWVYGDYKLVLLSLCGDLL